MGRITTITSTQHENMMKNASKENQDYQELYKQIQNDKIVDAFIEGDECKLLELHKTFPTIPFYKMLAEGVLPKVNVNMSYIMKSILKTKIDLLWGSFEFNNDVINTKFVNDLEDKLVRYGKILVKPIYDNKMIVEFELIKDYFVDDLDDDTFNEHYTIDEYKDIDQTYILKTIYKDNYQYHEVYFKNDLLNYSEWPSIFVDLEEIITFEHNAVYEVKQESSLKDIISINNTIDLIGTNIDWTIKNGKMLVIYSKSLSNRNLSKQGKAKTIDEQDGTGQIVDSYSFYVQETTVDGSVSNQKETITPDLSQLQILRELKDSLIIEAGNIMGISSITLGKELMVSSSASGESLKQREMLSNRTKQSERSARLEFLTKLSEDLGLEFKHTNKEDNENIDIEWARFWLEVRKLGDISKQGLYEKLHSKWTAEQETSEYLKLKKEQTIGTTTS